MNTSTDPIRITLPRQPHHHQQVKNLRGSIDSSSSTSESESPRKQDPSSNPRNINSYQSFKFPNSSIDPCETHSGRERGPIMKLFMRSPAPEVIPASSNNTPYSSSLCQSPAGRSSDVLFTQLTVIPDEDPSLRNSIRNSYNIMSLNSLRKQKMDRLRRKLGQDVPFDLVFPSSDTEPKQGIASSLSADVGVLPIPAPHPRKTGRISSARDSISKSTSVHRAKRQSTSRQTIAEPTEPSGSSPPEPEQIARLSLIIESPDEHGVGCAQEFGHSPKSERSLTFESEWTVNTERTEVKLWSTRRGYEGWDPKAPLNASPISRTMSSSPLPPSSMPSNTDWKKKPSSYRKPVPPLIG